MTLPSYHPHPGKLRLVDYLNPMAPLYFAAGRKGVSINTLTLTPNP